MKFFRSRLFAFVLAVTVLCVGLMIFSAYSGQPSILSKLLGAAVTPVQQAVSDAIDGVRDFFGYFYRYAALEEENARLKEELKEYRKMEQKYLLLMLKVLQKLLLNLVKRLILLIMKKRKLYISEVMGDILI